MVVAANAVAIKNDAAATIVTTVIAKVLLNFILFLLRYLWQVDSGFRPSCWRDKLQRQGQNQISCGDVAGNAEAKRGNPEACRSNVTRYRPGPHPIRRCASY